MILFRIICNWNLARNGTRIDTERWFLKWMINNSWIVYTEYGVFVFRWFCCKLKIKFTDDHVIVRFIVLYLVDNKKLARMYNYCEFQKIILKIFNIL